ncbi:MAG: MBL fold metallo-hydrolase [Pseudomonadota bacterium]
MNEAGAKAVMGGVQPARPATRRRGAATAALPVIAMPFEAVPAPGQAVEVAEGILWARMPLPMKLDHVNLFAIDEGTGWTLIDTGLNWARGREALDALLSGPLAGKPVERVVLTHHHPDHIGLAGMFAARGAEILASRIAWLTGRMLTLDPQERPNAQQIAFRRRAGVTGAALDAYATDRPFNFADCVAPIPLGFTALEEGDVLEAGGRRWQVRLGEGHAPAHVTLWSEDGTLVLAGDQILSSISPNIGVYPTEPEADPLGGWLESCVRFESMLGESGLDPLVLPGHHPPFRGGQRRLRQLIENHEHALERILAALASAPCTASGLFDPLYRRPIGGSEFGLALVEAVAHVNHLHRRELITPEDRRDGTRVWHIAQTA